MMRSKLAHSSTSTCSSCPPSDQILNATICGGRAGVHGHALSGGVTHGDDLVTKGYNRIGDAGEGSKAMLGIDISQEVVPVMEVAEEDVPQRRADPHTLMISVHYVDLHLDESSRDLRVESAGWK